MKSFAVVVMVTVQLLVSVSVARAIIFFLLMTSGDVEQNPGPEYTGMLLAFWLFDTFPSYTACLMALGYHMHRMQIP